MVSSPSPLLVILILTYIKNSFSLYTFPLKRLTNGILINSYFCLLSCFFKAT